MKRILPFLFFQLLTLVAWSQYVTPGTGVNWDIDDLVAHSDGVVIGSEGNYIITADLTIAQGDTLTFVNSGICEIFCEQDVLITIQGTMQALLDNWQENSIIFFGDEDYFKGFTFDNSDGSVLRNVNFLYAGGIKLIESDVHFRICSFKGFNTANCTGAVDIFKSNPVFSLCSFTINEGPGVKSAANAESAPQIDSCSFTYNVTSEINMPQINLGTTPAGDTIRITNCNIIGVEGYTNVGGIAVSTLAGGTLNAIIENTTIAECRYGIAVYGNNIFSIIRGNQIVYNLAADPMQGGSGISFWGDETNVSIVSGNIIHDNQWGITILNNAKPDLGDTENDDSPGENEIYDNKNNGQVYDLYNNSPGNIKAENNYWGSNNADTIEAHIYHHFDDPSLGTVDYVPFIIAEALPEEPAGKNHVIVYPVPAGDVLWIETDAGFWKKLTVFNAQGMKIKEVKRVGDKMKLDVSLWNNGVYLMTLQQPDGKKVVKKIVVQH